MNNKIAINTIYQHLKLKNKLCNQKEQKQNHKYREWFYGNQTGGGIGE